MREQTGGSHREQPQDADTDALDYIETNPDDCASRIIAALIVDRDARLVAAAERTAEAEEWADTWETRSDVVVSTMEQYRARADEINEWYGVAVNVATQYKAERDAALAQVELARRVTDAYTAEAEDHNDGEFALWKADDLINAIVALRAALGGPDA